MQQAALFGPVVEVRDVLESFLRDDVLVEGWRQRLADASREFVELGGHSNDELVSQLGDQVAILAESGLEERRSLTKSVAKDVEELLDHLRVPGLPKPEDQDWSF